MIFSLFWPPLHSTIIIIAMRSVIKEKSNGFLKYAPGSEIQFWKLKNDIKKNFFFWKKFYLKKMYSKLKKLEIQWKICWIYWFFVKNSGNFDIGAFLDAWRISSSLAQSRILGTFFVHWTWFSFYDTAMVSWRNSRSLTFFKILDAIPDPWRISRFLTHF